MAAWTSPRSDIAANADAYQVIAEWARDAALKEAEEAVRGVFPYNCELNPDGTEDAITAAWVEGGHDSWAAIAALRSGTEGKDRDTPKLG
jgi:hypothetical protein